MAQLQVVSTVLILAGLTGALITGCAGQPIVNYVEEKKAQVNAAEQTAAQTFVTSLNMAAQQYVIVAGAPPTGFTDFVAENASQTDSRYTVNVAALGSQDGTSGGCQVKPKEIDCTRAFNSIDVRYRWQEGGTVTMEVTPKVAASASAH